MVVDQELTKQIADLLSQADLPHKGLTITQCGGGRNNRTYRVETEGRVFVAKKYFNHPGDLRNRLKTEFAFLLYAENAATGMAPKPYAQNPAHHLALYEFIEGTPFTKGEVTKQEVDAAIHFFCKLNTPEARKHAHALGNASEACFSLADHFNLIQNRLHKLQCITPHTETEAEAHDGVELLHHYWSKMRKKSQEFDLETPLELEQRCISPSDFGFHNALRTSKGSLCFLDFEYGGWDDPAKMVGDFFAQLAVPVPRTFFEGFVQKTMALFPRSEQLVQRAKILQEVYVVKWCCIALNVFLPAHLERRQFAENNLDVAALQRSQLSKFKQMMQQLESRYGL